LEDARGAAGNRAEAGHPVTKRNSEAFAQSRADEFLHSAIIPSKETLGLEGQHWRQRAKDLKWASFLATLLPAWRSAAAALLLLVFLIPYGFGLAALAEREKPACGMQCCKGSKASCCRRSSKNANQAGPGWIASSKCPCGCEQLPAASGTLSASLVASRIEVTPIGPVSRLRISAGSPRGSSEAGFALFERPPPC
jgi:hypothetical protein